jgi:hypothetical protein
MFLWQPTVSGSGFKTIHENLPTDFLVSWQKEIPELFREHPEFDTARLRNPELQDSRELIHERTTHTRRFLNPDGSFTTVKSDLPLHFMDDNGWLRSFSYNTQNEITLNIPHSHIEDHTQLPSCFYPDFYQGDLTISITEGHLILNTYLEWDFVAVAGTSAWMADQRSYVSGPSGQTSVFNGTGNTTGTQTYAINTSIASGESPGEVTLSFFAARNWGGSGCTMEFNYISRRYIEIVHDDVEFGEGEIVINEYSASNRQMTDQFGNYEDWVELYNPSGSFVNIAGYYLSDDPDDILKWQFPGGIIPPGGHLLVICSGRDAMAGETPHTNFRLTQLKPESIILSDPDGNILESYPLFVTQNGHSFGRTTSGATTWGIFESPTPGSYNMGHKSGYTSLPEFSHSAGFYDGAFHLSLSTPDNNAVVRYTVDGSEPNSHSALYTGPISIDETTVVRARTFSNNPQIIPGFVETKTFFINESHTLPVFSFSGDELFVLFGGSQIETIGAFEYFDADGNFVDKSVGDFDKHGNDSWGYPQRGVDFISRDEYGYNRYLNHKFFPTSERKKFQRLMVKAAANDNYPFENGGAHIRDSYIQSLSQLIDLDLDVRSSLNVILYVNGDYWGVYDLREKVDDKDYTDYYYDQPRKYKGSTEYIQFLKTWGGTHPKYGEQQAVDDWNHIRSFIGNNSMADPGAFAYVDSILNLQSLIDYFVFNSYVVSRDWLNYNTGWWRGLHPDGGARQWRYILWDMEAALGHFHNYTGIPDVTANALPCNVENINVGNGHAQSLKKLITENEYVWRKYVTRYIDLLNTHLSCENAIHVLDSMVAVIQPEMPRQIARWGGDMFTWGNNVQNIRDFLNQRCDALVQGLKACYNLEGPFTLNISVYPESTGQIKMNSVWLPGYPFDAVLYGGIDTRLEAKGRGAWHFSHWEASDHILAADSLDPVIFFDLMDAGEITAVFHNPYADDNELLYYWHFNDLETQGVDIRYVYADYQLIDDANARMYYEGYGARDMDVFDEGSHYNLQFIEEPGQAIRVRNPSLNRSLLFNLPTTGYQDLVFSYAAQRSLQGMLEHHIYYSTDGFHFIQDELEQTSFTIGDEYEMITVDFSHIHAVNNNPDFHIRIEFSGNTSQSAGNNRFDNITLKGVEYVPTGTWSASLPEVKVYPNPSRDRFHISADEEIEALWIYDVTGSLLMKKEATDSNEVIADLSGFSHGLYFLNVKTRTGTRQLKIIRN